MIKISINNRISMENTPASTQSPIQKSSPSKAPLFISILLFLLLIFGSAAAYYYYNQYTSQKNNLDTQINNLNKTNASLSATIRSKDQLILDLQETKAAEDNTKKTESTSSMGKLNDTTIQLQNKEIASFSVGSTDSNLYVIDFVTDSNPLIEVLNNLGTLTPTTSYTNTYLKSYILSSYSPYFAPNRLFAIADNKIYAVNSVKNAVDIYILEKDDSNNPFFSLSHSAYIPDKNSVGTIYYIECQNNSCKVGTARHQEAGCEFSFNPQTLTFSNENCFEARY